MDPNTLRHLEFFSVPNNQVSVTRCSDPSFLLLTGRSYSPDHQPGGPVVLGRSIKPTAFAMGYSVEPRSDPISAVFHSAHSSVARIPRTGIRRNWTHKYIIPSFFTITSPFQLRLRWPIRGSPVNTNTSKSTRTEEGKTRKETIQDKY